ncbi:DUF7547 family protein [Halogeometricum limi]|uniref:Uncharacterized protein n=1 Tax=Halogeometricum limi TaxID=555875 RepID=A0A1I6GTR6_9EURY|nr:hypothetical protein [Halogeometricum limi]SFR45653.1 hypothetical protein SAMN04488124_1528 [Halogeometricum limi]
MSERRDPDDDLADLLSELDRTLGDLRHELRERERERSGERGDGRRDDTAGRDRDGDGYRRDDGPRDDRSRRRDPAIPRPPSLSELLRFTDEYTIPTVVSMLETTIRSLELLQRVLRLADPDRSAFDRDGRRRSAAERLATTNVGREALSGVDRALDDLRDALADLPQEAESRSIVTDARDLMAEIEARIDEAEQTRERSRYGYRDRRDETDDDRRGGGRNDEDRRTNTSPVTIDVADEDEGGAEDDPEEPQVDVEGELASIRKEVRGDDGDDDSGENADSGEESDDDRD